MRPSSRQRVAAWLLALPVGRGREECTRRGRLEMISFWLLCWKLLRATAGLRRPTAELTDGNHETGSHDNGNPSNSNPVNSSPVSTHPEETVAMEISSSAPLTEMERGDLIGCCSLEPKEFHYPGHAHEAREPITYQQEGEREGGSEEEMEREEAIKGEEDEKRDGDEGDRDSLLFELEGEVKGREGEGENEGANEETEGVVGEEENIERAEAEGADEEGGKTEERAQKVEDTSLSDLFFSLDSLQCPLAAHQQVTDSNLAEQQVMAMLEEGWCHDQGNRDDLSDGHLSDCLQAELAIVSSDSDAGEDQCIAPMPCDVTNQEDASGGTQDGICYDEGRMEVEEEGWEKQREGEPGRVELREIDEQRGREKKEDEERQVEGEEEEVKEDEAEIGGEEQSKQEEEEKGDKDDEAEQKRSGTHLLQLISPSVSSSASSTDHDKKVPADFRIQETHSENVSTEHVDFLIARQQWRKMEEEVKGQPLPQPAVRSQGSFQGTHSSLYPPTRSPRLKHREVTQQPPREAPLSSTLSPGSEDSGLDECSFRSALEESETAVEKEIRLTLEREERHRRERGMVAQGLAIPRPSSLHTGRSPPRPPACRTPTLSISPSPSPSSSLPRSVYHEMTANNVIILEPDSSHSASRNRLLSPSSFCDWSGGIDALPTTNVIIVETSNLIIRSASEFCLSSLPVSTEPQESTFSSNPFFKLRSLSSQSLVEQEIRMVRQREEEWRRQREEEWRKRREEEWRRGREKERYDTVLVSPALSDNISYNASEVPDRCVSSPSSPSRSRKMERSSLSCDHKWFR